MGKNGNNRDMKYCCMYYCYYYLDLAHLMLKNETGDRETLLLFANKEERKIETRRKEGMEGRQSDMKRCRDRTRNEREKQLREERTRRDRHTTMRRETE